MKIDVLIQVKFTRNRSESEEQQIQGTGRAMLLCYYFQRYLLRMITAAYIAQIFPKSRTHFCDNFFQLQLNYAVFIFSKFCANSPERLQYLYPKLLKC